MLKVDMKYNIILKAKNKREEESKWEEKREFSQ